eukprot:Cvel_32971.t1-p1 / transcript=Cvel_32971.t1 / gene=Cvel_32971 / organism=Chromera_velia_CCMP2878 / gene_product=hypothetical protein / transcript_product=hypothetical protein / location=Cvel_scaffold5239:5501-6048(+) / protein_length=182 / sequence_SO=supercontig / SO=protein_coding / is_pseudo=false
MILNLAKEPIVGKRDGELTNGIPFSAGGTQCGCPGLSYEKLMMGQSSVSFVSALLGLLLLSLMLCAIGSSPAVSVSTLHGPTIPFTYKGPLIDATFDDTQRRATYEKIGTSGLDERAVRSLEQLKAGEIPYVILKTADITGLPLTPVTEREGSETVLPPELFGTMASVSNFLGTNLGMKRYM